MKGPLSVLVAAAFLAALAAPAHSQEKGAKKAAEPSKAKAAEKKGAEKKTGEEAEGEGEGQPTAPDAGVPEGKKEPAGDETPEPEFRNQKGAEFFKKGQDLFVLGKYKDALSEFNKAKDLLKTAKDRQPMDVWMNACKGGMALDAYRKEIDRGLIRTAFFKVVENGDRFKGTPIHSKFRELEDEIRPKAVLVLEDFDDPSPRFTKKMGKQFISDPKIVFRGANCLQWNSTKGALAQLLVKGEAVPKKWNAEFHSVCFWVWMEQPVELSLIAISAPPKKDQEPDAMEAAISPSAKQGWTRVEIPLDQFKKHGIGTFGNVERFLFQIDSKTAYKFYIDEILLVRKDPAERGAPEPADDSSKKTGKKAAKTSAGKVKQTETKKTK